MGMSLKYTGQEALQAIKEYYPKDFLQMIEEAKLRLQRLAKLRKTDEKTAYKYIISCGGDKVEVLVLFAALYEIIEAKNIQKLLQKRDELELEKQNLSNQVYSLETSNAFNYEDKKILRSYYKNRGNETNSKLEDVEQKINEYINSIKVVEPKLVIYQTDIFNRHDN